MSNNNLDCVYVFVFVFVACAVGSGSYEFLNILKLLSNCADFECLQEVLCLVSVVIQKGMGNFLRKICWNLRVFFGSLVF
jgi:hypothetical protein